MDENLTKLRHLYNKMNEKAALYWAAFFLRLPRIVRKI